MNNIGWIIFGVAFLAIYTWNVIEIAANIAVRRIERQFAAAMNEDDDDQDDIIDRLDHMWGKHND